MIETFNPDNGPEVLLVGFLALCSLVGAVLPVWLKVRRIDTQVSNSHSENLRDEITRGFSEIRKDIGGLREEIRTERLERIEGDKRDPHAA